jgi:hypothetical protein
MLHVDNRTHTAGSDCRSCGSPIAADDPILAKFQRCYYCGRRHPLASRRTLTTVPVIIATVAGLFAIWWTHLSS